MYHQITAVGNVGGDAEMRYTPQGVAVASFTVATNRSYKSGDEKVEETTWFRVTCWGKMAETANSYVRKGMKILIAGRLETDAATGGPRVWVDKQGNSRASFEITAETMRFLSWANDEAPTGPASKRAPEGVDEDYIPF